jgi:hypothetical protein
MRRHWDDDRPAAGNGTVTNRYAGTDASTADGRTALIDETTRRNRSNAARVSRRCIEEVDMLRRTTQIALASALVAGTAAFAPAAHADRVGFNFSIGGPGYGVTVGNAPWWGPRYYAPVPVYVAPPVVYAPPRVVYYTPPRVVYRVPYRHHRYYAPPRVYYRY